jgi:hypothetical protein
MKISWLQRLTALLPTGNKYAKSQLTPACQLALNNIAQRLLVADQAVKQATQPITNRGFFEHYIERSTQLSLDSATHDYYYDKQLSKAARASARLEHNAEVLHRHMGLLRKSLRSRLKATAEKLHGIRKQEELGLKSRGSDAGPTPASVACVYKMLDELLAELQASLEKAKESSTRIKKRSKTEKQVELCFTQLELGLDNLKNDLGPLKQALKDTVIISAEKQ